MTGTYGQTLLHIVDRRNLPGICRWLLRLGANVNRTDILDRTALHYAVRHNAADVTRLLIVHGVDLDAKDWQGHTPLDLSNDENGVVAMIQEATGLRHGQKVKALKVLRGPRKTDCR